MLDDCVRVAVGMTDCRYRVVLLRGNPKSVVSVYVSVSERVRLVSHSFLCLLLIANKLCLYYTTLSFTV